MTREVRIHLDTLQYTRKGLKTREGIALDVGHDHRVVLVRPDRVAAPATSGVAFAPNCAFPRPGLLMSLWTAKPTRSAFTHHRGQDPRWGGRHVQLFGHTDPDERDAKALSERRARVAAALLTSDVHLFESVCAEERWGDWTIQSMLRALACDPGPVDGAIERLTIAAVHTFAERYNRGVYHRDHPDSGPRALEPSDALDENTRCAIREAFVLVHGLGPGSHTLLPHHATHGCSAFNRLGDATPTNRRMTILSHAAIPVLSENAPCTVGDEQACAVVDDHPYSCMWFREHAIETTPAPPRLFDPRWLWIRDDRYVLSALTTAEDGESVLFEVSDGGAKASDGEGLEGVVRGGVAAVVWASGMAHDEADGRPSDLAEPRFRVHHPAFEASSTEAKWPEREALEVLQLCDDAASVHRWSGGIRVTAQDGSYERYTPYSEAIARSTRHLVLVFPDVPSNGRVDIVHESGELRRKLLAGVIGETVSGNCLADEQCSELPPAPPAPDYSLDDLELDDYASVDIATEVLPPFEFDQS